MEEARWLFAGQAVGAMPSTVMLPCPDRVRVPPRVTSTDMRGD